MTALYVFFAAAGVPLVLWALFGGGDEVGVGDLDAGGDAGPVMLRFLPLSSMAIAAAAFGIGGLALGASGLADGPTFFSALTVAVVAAVLNSTAFTYLRRTDSSSDVRDVELAGAVGRVSLALGPGRRGRVVVALSDRQLTLTAEGIDGTEPLEQGEAVVVVEVERGVARVARLDLP
jgi:membrane protein implicated in regulation of membrane protease activity